MGRIQRERQKKKLLGQLGLTLGAWYLQLKQNSTRRWWVRPINQNRLEQGDYYNLLQEMRLRDTEMFFNYTRLDVEQFDNLLNIVGPELQKTSYREFIPPGARLALTLRHLAAGDSIPSLSFAFRIGKSTACCIINETCDAIWNNLCQIVLKEPNNDEWKAISKDYEDIWNLPNCVGAIDGKHVAIRAPYKSGSFYFNYKKSFSIVLFAVSDANYCFSYVDIGAYGSQSDGGVLRNSSFGSKLNNNLLQLPENKAFPGRIRKTPHFFVGDEAFPLQMNLMRPFGGNRLSIEERIYNYRLSRARRCIENSFGIMVARFRIFHTTIFKNPENVDRLIKCAVCLHNYIKRADVNKRRYVPQNFVDVEVNGEVIPGRWRNEVPPECSFRNISELRRRIGCRNATTKACEYRDYIKNYVNTIGAVPWQNEKNV